MPMNGAPSAMGGVDLPPPPSERWWERLRRRWRSRGRHPGLRYWLLTRGLPLLFAFFALFVVNGAAIGWGIAYDVSIGITSPRSTEVPLLAWPLSVAGWLVATGVTGAVAGSVVGVAVSTRRTRPLEPQVFHEDADGR